MLLFNQPEWVTSDCLLAAEGALTTLLDRCNAQHVPSAVDAGPTCIAGDGGRRDRLSVPDRREPHRDCIQRGHNLRTHPPDHQGVGCADAHRVRLRRAGVCDIASPTASVLFGASAKTEAIRDELDHGAGCVISTERVPRIARVDAVATCAVGPIRRCSEHPEALACNPADNRSVLGGRFPIATWGTSGVKCPSARTLPNPPLWVCSGRKNHATGAQPVNPQCNRLAVHPDGDRFVRPPVRRRRVPVVIVPDGDPQVDFGHTEAERDRGAPRARVARHHQRSRCAVPVGKDDAHHDEVSAGFIGINTARIP